MKKIIDCMLYGVGIGMFWYLFSLFFWKIAEQTSQQILVTVFFSALMGLSALIYEQVNLSMLGKTSLHFMAILALVVVMTGLNGWVDLTDLSYLLGFFIQFGLIYLVIWVIIYLINRRQVQQINENLRKQSR